MEHPFISSLSEKSLEELQTDLSELNKKLTYAMRTMNQPLIYQLRMALESYRNEYNKQMDEMFKRQNIEMQVNIEKDN